MAVCGPRARPRLGGLRAGAAAWLGPQGRGQRERGGPAAGGRLLDAARPALAARQGPPDPGRSARAEALAPLSALGFSSAQAVQLVGLQPRLAPARRLAVVCELLLLGLDAAAALAALRRDPAVLSISAQQLRQRAAALRKLGLAEGSLQRVVSHCPALFTLPGKKIDAAVRVLREKCLFTVDQYVYFRMGVKHKAVVKSGLFQTPIAEIKNRHIFLERLGLYQTPDKKGQTQIVNPKLKEIIQVSEGDFLANIAHSSLEEFEVFKRLLAREEEEVDQDTASDERERDSEGEQSDSEKGN
ncbi:transcription termination factor 4, mitochondrial isoform X2 [Carettochelys insculpta]|uniref:transcription termination factor 4, mitochondrial isoform X2 n=1 Tax=Carettochelys insculpta TaxID=44489 RepID=UPI003EBDD9DC